MYYFDGYQDGLRFAAQRALFDEHSSDKCVHPCRASNEHCACRRWARDEDRIEMKIKLWKNET